MSPPQNVTTDESTTATFYCTTSCRNPIVHVTSWMYNDDVIVTSRGSRYTIDTADAQNISLSFTALADDNKSIIRCVLRCNDFNCTSEAILTVTTGTKL